jgi:hypothetical protein
MSHSSIMPWTLNGTKMYVYSAVGGVVGIAADGPEAGSVLWKSLKWGCSVVAPSPVCLPNGTLFSYSRIWSWQHGISGPANGRWMVCLRKCMNTNPRMVWQVSNKPLLCTKDLFMALCPKMVANLETSSFASILRTFGNLYGRVAKPIALD